MAKNGRTTIKRKGRRNVEELHIITIFIRGEPEVGVKNLTQDSSR